MGPPDFGLGRIREIAKPVDKNGQRLLDRMPGLFEESSVANGFAWSILHTAAGMNAFSLPEQDEGLKSIGIGTDLGMGMLPVKRGQAAY